MTPSSDELLSGIAPEQGIAPAIRRDILKGWRRHVNLSVRERLIFTVGDGIQTPENRRSVTQAKSSPTTRTYSRGPILNREGCP